MKTNCCDVVSVETGKIVEVPTVAEFRASLAGADACDIVDAYLLTDGAVHVRDDDITYISQSVAASYGVSTADVRVFVTGSAKLGFSIVERTSNGLTAVLSYRRSNTNDASFSTAVLIALLPFGNRRIFRDFRYRRCSGFASHL